MFSALCELTCFGYQSMQTSVDIACRKLIALATFFALFVQIVISERSRSEAEEVATAATEAAAAEMVARIQQGQIRSETLEVRERSHKT